MISVLFAEKTKMFAEECQENDFLKQAAIGTLRITDSGKAAWELFLEYRPELVILETELLDVDGFEVAHRIRKEASETMLIFLSRQRSYEEIQKALKLHAEAFYVKEELSLEEWRHFLKEAARKQNHKTFLNQWIQQCQLSNYFLGKYGIEGGLLNELFPKKMDFMVLEEDHMLPAAIEMMGEEEGKENGIVMKRIRELSDVDYLVYLAPYRYLCFYEKSVDLDQKAYDLKETLKEATGSSFSAFLLCRMSDMETCHERYQKMEGLFRQRYFEGEGVVLDSFFHEEKEADSSPIALEELHRSLERGLEDECMRELSELFFPVLRDRDYERLSNLTKGILKLISNYDRQLFSIQNQEVFHFQKGDREEWKTAKGTVRWIRNRCREIVMYKREEHQLRCSKYVTEAVRYIIAEYKNPNLSVEEVAAHAGMGVNRMNELFKRELGETVGHFITSIRMEKAKQLLEDGMRIGELNGQIGYYSSAYFSKVFKKNCLLSPKEYQKQFKICKI